MSESGAPSYNFGDNLTYMFQDPRWASKLLVGALVGLVPILNLATGGYALRVVNNIRKDESPPMPDWSGEFGQFFTDGLLLFVIGLIYSIPLWLIGAASGVPLALLGAASENRQMSDGLGVLFGATSCILAVLGFVYLVALVFWLQGAIVNYAVQGNFGAAFAFGEIWAIIQRNLNRMMLTVAAVVVASVLIAIVSSVLALIPCCGWIAAMLISLVTAFYLQLVMGYTCGYIAKDV